MPLLAIVLLEYVPNERMLCCGVRLAILRELLLQGFLQVCIRCAECFVGFEHVPEPQVVAPPGIVSGYHVQMMRPDVRGRFFHEEVTPLVAIAAIQIAEGTFLEQKNRSR